MNRLTIVALMTCLALGAGCGNNNDNAATNNAATNNNSATNNNAETNNSTENNNDETNNNVATNNDNNNTMTNSQRDEPYVAEFTYYEETENALGSIKDGITLNLSARTIANLDGNSSPMTAEDVTAFDEAHMTDTTIANMRNGWGCPEPMADPDMGMGSDAGTDMGTGDMGTSTIGGSTWWFEARIQEDGRERQIKEITGCVQDGDPATQAIIDALDELGTEYL